MSVAKGDVNVSELLQQLEELKQKKARNVKKLKRKLGRAVLLKQPDSSTESAIDALEKKPSNHKSKTPEARNVLSELKCKDSFLSNILSTQNKTNPTTGTGKFADNFSDANFNLPLQDKNAPDALQMRVKPPLYPSTERKLLNNDVLKDSTVLLKKDFSCLNPLVQSDETIKSSQSLVYKSSRKRSAEFSEDQIVNQSAIPKKTKISSEGTSGAYRCTAERTLSPSESFKTDKEPISPTPKPLCGQHHGNEEILEDNSICFLSSNLLRTNTDSNFICSEQHDWSPALSAEKTLHPKEENNHVEVSDDGNVNSFCQIAVDSCLLIQDEQNLVLVQETCALAENMAALLTENEPVTGSPSQVPMCSVKSEDSSLHAKQLMSSGIGDDIDLNVTEVADTEVIFLAKSQPEVINTEGIFVINSEMELANLQDECLVNFQQDVANFEEVSTETSQQEIVLPAEDSDPGDADFDDFETKSVNFEDLNSQDFDPDNGNTDDIENIKAGTDDSLLSHSPMEAEANFDVDYVTKSQLPAHEDPCIGNEEVEINRATELCVKEERIDSFIPESEVLMVPETEIFDLDNYNKLIINVDHGTENESITDNYPKSKDTNIKDDKLSKSTYTKSDTGPNLDTVISDHSVQKPPSQQGYSGINVAYMEPEQACNSPLEEIVCNQLCSEANFDTDSLGTEDFLKLVNYHQIPFGSEKVKSNLHEDKEANFEDHISNLKFTCCLQSEITEAVSKLKLIPFNNSLYLFIQHTTWIQVWRQEKDWIKIFSHQVEDQLQLQEMCLSHNENYLVLVLLLISKEHSHCLQFLVFERESRLIKLMEHTHWFENRCEPGESVFLCGLGDLRFASAQGQSNFNVYSHSFSCLEDNPRLATVTLGSAADSLHSLCPIDKLPNALLGISSNMLYVWHLLEARLVTSVRLQVEDSLTIENCIWTTVENGLVFLMASCKDQEGPEVCQLLAANLATGFCQVALTYTLQPAEEVRLPADRNITLVYSEPLIGVTCKNGAFIWSVEEDYCCASLKEKNLSSIAIVPTAEESFLIVVGCDGGCVSCYELKCR